MSIEADDQDAAIGRQVAEIVAAYVANNDVPRSGVAALIVSMGEALRNLYAPNRSEAKRSLPTQAEISKSITKDFLISFIDGKRYKALKRHLRTHGFDAASYRARYGLPIDYPVVSPSYSEKRSDISRTSASRRRVGI